MLRSEIAVLAVMGFNLFLILLRCFGVRDERGKVAKRYQVGKSMAIGDRQIQEDCCGISRTQGGLLAVLADGMGQGYGGKAAAKAAVDTMGEIFAAAGAEETAGYFLQRAFYGANREILKRLDGGRGGASVAAVLIRDDLLYYALAGNIKVAVYRNRRLVPVSAGHTLDVLAEEQYDQGQISRADALGLMESKRLYNWLGQDGFEKIEQPKEPIALKSGDTVVLMSDGVVEGADWRELEESLSRRGSCQAKAEEITGLIGAGSRTDKDNASIILIEQP